MPRSPPRAPASLAAGLALAFAACGGRPPSGSSSPRSSSPRSSSPPPSVWTAPRGDLEVLFKGEAWDAAALAGALVILEADARHLRAIDLDDGALRWRLSLPRAPAGVHSLAGAGDRIFHHVANQVQVIGADGRLLHAGPAPYNDPTDVRLAIEGGACVFHAGCDLHPIACATGAPLGEPLRGGTITFHDDGATVCASVPKLIGAVEGLTLLVTAVSRGEAAVLARDGAGALRWRLDRRVAGESGYRRAGMAADGGVCWLAAAASALFFTCTEGQVLWESDLPGVTRVDDLRWFDVDGGQIWWRTRREGGGGEVEVRDARTGERRWAAEIADDALPWPLGASVAGAGVGARGALQVHDLRSGEVVARFEVGAGERLLDDPGGGYLIVGEALIELDPQAQERRRRPLAGTRLAPNSLMRVTPEHLLVYDQAGAAILDRDDLAPALQIEGRVALLSPAGLPPEVMVLRVDGGEEVRPWVIAVGPRRSPP